MRTRLIPVFAGTVWLASLFGQALPAAEPIDAKAIVSAAEKAKYKSPVRSGGLSWQAADYPADKAPQTGVLGKLTTSSGKTRIFYLETIGNTKKVSINVDGKIVATSMDVLVSKKTDRDAPVSVTAVDRYKQKTCFHAFGYEIWCITHEVIKD